MKRRLRWIIPALVLLAMIGSFAWPRDDGYNFLRKIGGRESYGGDLPETRNAPWHVFEFQPGREAEIKTRLDQNWRKDYGNWLTPSGHLVSLYPIDDARTLRPKRLVVVINEPEPWLDRQIDAVKRLLHLA